MARRPDFLLIGAQKAGTSWLWRRVLDPHPGTDLGNRKEIHFFGGVENFRRGTPWYYAHFDGLDPQRVIGEASTSYFYDRVPYWHNASDEIEFDPGLPPLPELVTAELPDARILVVLRDPVSRAVSAFKHQLRKDGPARDADGRMLGLAETARRHPKLRILEYGHYAQYLRAWMRCVPPERLHLLIFEEDVVREPERMAAGVYGFLGLDTSFAPDGLRRREHATDSVTRSVVRTGGGRVWKRIVNTPLGDVFDRFDVLARRVITPGDMAFLHEYYRPHKAELEDLLGRGLPWKLGAAEATA